MFLFILLVISKIIAKNNKKYGIIKLLLI